MNIDVDTDNRKCLAKAKIGYTLIEQSPQWT